MTTRAITALTGVAAVLVAGSVAASACPLSYEQFELGVPHTDMETCPESIALDGVYCRASLNAETVTIFVFSERTDCIVETRAYAEEAYTLTVD